ncbi:MAG: L-fucose:H+ symporter permease [Brevinema sp.]
MSIPKTAKMLAKKDMLTFGFLVSCFVLWGLLNNMTDNLVPAFAKIFMIKAVDSSLVQLAFYGAYALLALPAAYIIQKYSYRQGILAGLGLYVIGAFGYIPAAVFQNYHIFLVSIFTLAGGLSILETTCNPFVLSLGDSKTSIQRLNFAQAFNPLGSIAGIFIAKWFILSNLRPESTEERLLMTPDQLAILRSTELFWVCIPYLTLILIALIIWCYFFKNKFEVKDTKSSSTLSNTFSSLSKNKVYCFGVITQFFYVGLQIGTWTWIIKYVMTLTSINEAQAADIYIYSIIIFITMRWICTALMRIIAPVILMLIIGTVGILFSLGTIYLPVESSILCLIGISGSMSLMFPTIYGIALQGLPEKDIKFGAAGLIMAILGGAILTPWMGSAIDTGAFSSLAPMFSGAKAAVRTSYFIPLLCFVCIVLYGLYVMNYPLKENSQ